MNLKYKLLLQFLLVTVFLLLVYSVVWIGITRNQMITASSHAVSLTADQANSLVDNFFSLKFAELSLSDRVTDGQLQSVLQRDKDIIGLTVLAPDGTEQTQLSFGTSMQASGSSDLSKTAGFKLATFLGGTPRVGPVKDGYATLFVPIKAAGADSLAASASSGLQVAPVAGVVAARVALAPLWAQLQSVTTGNGGYVFVVDTSGKLLDYPDSKKFAVGKDMLFAPEVQQFVKDTANTTSVHENTNEAGMDSLTYHVQNIHTGWGIIAQTPLSGILQPINHIIWYAIFLFLAALMLAALLSLTLEDGTVTAFRKLQQGFDNFTNGNFWYHIDAGGEGEIEKLSKQLNKLVGEIYQERVNIYKERVALAAEEISKRQRFARDEANLRQIMINETNRLQQTLSDEKEKVNLGLFVEKEKWNALTANITDGIILLDKTRKIVYLNKSAEDLLKFYAADLINKFIPAAMKIFEKEREVTWDEYAPLQLSDPSKGTLIKKEKVRLENPNISPTPIRLITIKTDFNKTDDLGYILILRSRLEETAVEKSKSEFIPAIMRDLQPAYSLMLQCFPLLKQTFQGEPNVYLTGLQTGIDELTLVMNNLLLAEYLEKGTITFNFQPVALGPFITETIEGLVAQTQAKQLTITFEQPKEPVPLVTADLLAVREVLLNLLNNAIKFSERGSVITVSLREFEDQVFIEVKDSGIGIAKENFQNLYTKFFTVPPASGTDQTGTGLGLYLSKAIVEIHQGKVWYDSVEGRGSTFGFSLPKAVTDTADKTIDAVAVQ